MKVAITGGTGFIGRKLARRHHECGDEVRVLSRKPFNREHLQGAARSFQADLADENADLIPFVDGVDILYHCAGEVRNPSLMQALQINGTARLIKAAASRIRHWVQLSSVGAYGSYRHGTVIEETPMNPSGLYETTKAESDRLVERAGKSGAFTFSILRPSIVYGPNMTNQSLLQLISVIEKGLFFFIGKPGASANYIHVDNVVEGLMMCGLDSAAKGQVYNLSDYRTIETFIVAIAESLGSKSPNHRLPEPFVRAVAYLASVVPGMPLSASRIDALTNRTIYPINKISYELGYTHRICMEEGLRELVDFWRSGCKVG